MGRGFLRPQQRALLEDGDRLRHFTVVTNRWEMDGQALLEWHRGKAGTIEHMHHILVSELGAGVYPSGKHGATRPGSGFQVLTYNLAEVLEAVVLPPEYRPPTPSASSSPCSPTSVRW